MSALLPLVRRELRALFARRAPWWALAAAGPLAGVACARAVDAFRASGDGDTLAGVVAPTLGAVLVSTSLSFPFIAAAAFARDKHTDAMLGQLGHRAVFVVAAKALALFVAFAASTLPALLALAGFALAGGHVYGPSLLAAFFGQVLVGTVVAGAGAVAGAVTEGYAAAALVTLAAAAGLVAAPSWGAHAPGPLAALAALAPTAALEVFSRGVVEVRLVVVLALAAAALLLAGAVLRAPAAALDKRIVRAVVVVVVFAGVGAGAARVPSSFDASEGRRNSFPGAITAALAKIGDPVRVTLRLRADDPRSAQLERTVLEPLGRAARVEVKRLVVDDRTYGLSTVQVGTRAEETRATTPEEIVPIVLGLAGVKAPPFVADAAPAAHPFSARTPPLAVALPCALWPLLMLAGLLLARRR